MGWAVLSAPGTQFGPCGEPCKHTDCAATRQMAASPCDLCGKPIGYETRFYQRPSQAFVHASCLENEQERLERQINDVKEQAKEQASQVQFACPPTPTTAPNTQYPPHFAGAWWLHFWNRQRSTAIHLFRDYPERGYANRGVDESKSLCGLEPGYSYTDAGEWTAETSEQGWRLVCRTCARHAKKIIAGYQAQQDVGVEQEA